MKHNHILIILAVAAINVAVLVVGINVLVKRNESTDITGLSSHEIINKSGALLKTEELESKEEQKKKELAEKKRQQEEKKRKELAEKKRQQQAAEAKRKLEADERARQAILARAAAARVEGEAANALGLAVGRIAAAVDSNWIQPQSSTLGLEVIIRVNVSPGGAVMSARVVRSSGNALFDRSAEIAVQKASPLPIPNDPRYYPHIKEFDFRFKPNG